MSAPSNASTQHGSPLGEESTSSAATALPSSATSATVGAAAPAAITPTSPAPAPSAPALAASSALAYSVAFPTAEAPKVPSGGGMSSSSTSESIETDPIHAVLLSGSASAAISHLVPVADTAALTSAPASSSPKAADSKDAPGGAAATGEPSPPSAAAGNGDGGEIESDSAPPAAASEASQPSVFAAGNLFLPPFYSGGPARNPASVQERDVFLSHYQATGADLALALSTALLAADLTSWYDMNMAPWGLTPEHMREGVRRCGLFCLLLTSGALERPAVRMELAEALREKKRTLLLVPADTCDDDYVRAQVAAGVAKIRSAPENEKWLRESELFEAVAPSTPRVALHVGTSMRSVTVQGIADALRRLQIESDSAAALPPPPRRRRRRALEQRLGSHSVPSGGGPVLLVGVRGRAFVEYLRCALLLACPTLQVRVLGGEDRAGPSPAPKGDGQKDHQQQQQQQQQQVIALLEPDLFSDAAAVDILAAQPLERLHLLFDKVEKATFGAIMAATPEALRARAIYTLNAVDIQRNVERRWPELCALLGCIGAVPRRDAYPPPPLPPAYDASISAATLAAMKGALAPSGGASSCAIVVGGRGGLGKTSVASAFAADEDTRDAFDIIVWATVGRSAGRGALRSVLENILCALDGASALTDAVFALELEALAARVRASIERPTRRVLLVTDDLSDAEHGEHFAVLSCLVPTGDASDSLVLATMRDVEACARRIPASARAVVARMDALPIDVAAHLLASASGFASSSAALPSFRALAEEVGRSPYALQLAARILRQTDIDDDFGGDIGSAAHDVRVRVAAACVRPSLLGAGAPAGSAPVYRAIEVVLAETFAPRDRNIFSTFGLFAEDADIPVGVLCAAWRRSEADRDRLLGSLADAALIKRNGAFVQLHDFSWMLARAERTLESAAVKQRAFLARAKEQFCGGGGEPPGGGSGSWAAIHRVADVAVRTYLFRSLGHHLCAARRTDEFTELLFSLDWLAVAIHNKGLQDVIRDVLNHARVCAGADAVDLRHLFQTLQFSAPGLFEGAAMRERLVAQLIGRLRGIGAVVQEGTRMGRLLAEAEAFAAKAMRAAEEMAVAGGDDGKANQTWLLPVARTAILRGPGGALQATLLGHSKEVNCACLLPNGLLASASRDKSVRVWNVSSGECLKTLTGHGSWVMSVVSLGPESGLIASASYDKTVRIWNVGSGACLKTLTGHEGWIMSVCSLGPDSGLIASASFDKTVRIWNVGSGACLKTLTGHEGLVNCVCSLGLDSGLIASASADKTARIWNVHSGECLKTLTGHENWVMSICSLEPDSDLLASASTDRTVRIWNVSSGTCVKTLTGHESFVNCVASLGPASGLIASASNDKTVRIWNVSSGACVQTLTGHEHFLLSICLLDPDSGLIASASYDKTVRIWNRRSGECLKALTGHESVNSVVSLGPDSGLIASASNDKTVRIWCLSSGECVKTLTGHEGYVMSITLLGPDSGLIASASFDKTVRIWSVSSGQCLKALTGHEGLVNSVCLLGPDGGLIASASADTTVRIWSVSSGKCLKILTGHEGGVNSIASLGPDSGLIASASTDHAVRIWHVSSGECVKTLTGHKYDVNYVCSLGPDSGMIASGSGDNTVRVWNVHSGVCVKTLTGHEDWVMSICLRGPDSGLVASASRDNTVRIWNVRSGECTELLPRDSERARKIIVSSTGQIHECVPFRLLNFRASHAAFLDADIHRVCPVQPREASKGRPLDTVAVFTTAHQFRACALLPVISGEM